MKVRFNVCFIKRITSEFELSITFKALYCIFFRLILEYSSVSWKLSVTITSCQFERVQHKFLKFVNYILKIDCSTHTYILVLLYLHLDSLVDRRLAVNLTFIHNLLNKISQIFKYHKFSLIFTRLKVHTISKIHPN